ncbi:Universal stress protein family protein [Stieleria neptunia]|uniref:Universal stress protein family protein n=1 Tax=Stieleria neptunia TaxID=2527979 RepID=A0A518HW49_9BACT|nr:universal stress protein [Stieleria neptunia]QDV45080.1 Universal stress protein family protein [Stieleria neptunia]
MRILVPTAGEEAAVEIADYVILVARQLDAELTVLHILKDDESKAAGRDCCAVFLQAAHDTGVSVTSRVAMGDVVDTIIAAAKDIHADLVLMGASSGTVVENWLSANVMDQCDVPVLVVPHCYRRF